MKKPKDTGPSCITCQHWQEQTESGDEVRWGFCRRYPPTVIQSDEGAQIVQAWTEIPNVCGEHRERLNG